VGGPDVVVAERKLRVSNIFLFGHKKRFTHKKSSRAISKDAAASFYELQGVMVSSDELEIYSAILPRYF